MTALWLLPVAAFIAFSWWAARDLQRWVDFSRHPDDYDIFARTRREIRELPTRGGTDDAAIGRELGVDEWTVSRARRGTAWH